MNAKKQFLYSASVPARECWIDRERGRSHYKIKTKMLPYFQSKNSTFNNLQLTSSPKPNYQFTITQSPLPIPN